MLVSYCVNGEGPQEEPGRSREAGWGKGKSQAKVQVQLVWSWPDPTGSSGAQWYHGVLSLSRQGAGPWHHVPISHWPWSAHAGLWGASLDEVAILQRTMS